MASQSTVEAREEFNDGGSEACPRLNSGRCAPLRPLFRSYSTSRRQWWGCFKRARTLIVTDSQHQKDNDIQTSNDELFIVRSCALIQGYRKIRSTVYCTGCCCHSQVLSSRTTRPLPTVSCCPPFPEMSLSGNQEIPRVMNHVTRAHQCPSSLAEMTLSLLNDRWRDGLGQLQTRADRAPP